MFGKRVTWSPSRDKRVLVDILKQKNDDEHRCRLEQRGLSQQTPSVLKPCEALCLIPTRTADKTYMGGLFTACETSENIGKHPTPEHPE